jgi:CRP/FNR family transcriptional regulator
MQNIPISHVEKVQALRQVDYFKSLGLAVLDSLALGVSLRRYNRGEIIFWESDPCSGLHIIKKGSVKLFKLSPQGRELIINTNDEGTSFNEVPVFDDGENPVNAAALENCEIWVVDAAVIRHTMEDNPEMCKAVIQSLSANLRMMVSKVEELSFYQVTNRLARLISRLPPEQLEEQHITQDQLAARLGTVREVVARSLRDLERSGAIRVERRQIQVLNEQLLRDWGQEPLN